MLILLVALIVLGPKSLAGFSRKLGKFVGEFRRASTDFQRALNAEAAREEAREAERKKEAGAAAKSGEPGAKRDQDLTDEDLRLSGVPEDSPLAKALRQARGQARNADKEAAAAEKAASEAEAPAKVSLDKKAGGEGESVERRP